MSHGRHYQPNQLWHLFFFILTWYVNVKAQLFSRVQSLFLKNTQQTRFWMIFFGRCSFTSKFTYGVFQTLKVYWACALQITRPSNAAFLSPFSISKTRGDLGPQVYSLCRTGPIQGPFGSFTVVGNFFRIFADFQHSKKVVWHSIE